MFAVDVATAAVLAVTAVVVISSLALALWFIMPDDSSVTTTPDTATPPAGYRVIKEGKP